MPLTSNSTAPGFPSVRMAVCAQLDKLLVGSRQDHGVVDARYGIRDQVETIFATSFVMAVLAISSRPCD